MLNSHPWNDDLWDPLIATAREIPHALLLVGSRGLGKSDFALRLAASQLCPHSATIGQACGQCQSCRLFLACTHPDLHMVQAESTTQVTDGLMADYAQRYHDIPMGDRKPRTVIGVDVIRQLIDALITHPHLGHRKVAVIHPADAMNLNASNALLKLVEEPPTDTLLLLITTFPFKLPPTLRSRCMKVDFKAPHPNVARQWLTTNGVAEDTCALFLALAGGAPLKALALAKHDFIGQRDEWLSDVEGLINGVEDPIACASRWQQTGAAVALEWLQNLTSDLITLAAVPAPPRLHNADVADRLCDLNNNVESATLHGLYDNIGKLRAILDSVDERLLIEDILIKLTPRRESTQVSP